MLDIIECGRGKLDDPQVMEWALDCYENALLRSPETASIMEEKWFDAKILGHWIVRPDEMITPSMFRILPAHLFASIRAEAVERWNSWDENVVEHAMPVLLLNPVEEVVALFSRHINSDVPDFDKIFAIIKALPSLPLSYAQSLYAQIISQIEEMGEGKLKYDLLESLLGPVARFDIEELPVLVSMLVLDADIEPGEVSDRIDSVCRAMFDTSRFLQIADDVMEGAYDTRPFIEMQVLFADGTPLDECENILRDEDQYAKAVPLLEKYRDMSDRNEMALKIARSMEDAVDEANIARFAVLAVLDAFELKEIDTGNLSMEEALDILFLDIETSRHFDALCEHLGTFDKQQLVDALILRMDETGGSYGIDNLARLPGRLRLVEAIPTMIDAIGEESEDQMCEAASGSLEMIGKPAQAVLIRRWDELDSSQQIYGSSVIKNIGGQEVLDFTLDHFDDMFHGKGTSEFDAEKWCMLAMAVPSVRTVALLEREVHRKQGIIDDTFYLLCLLTRYEYKDLEQVKERVFERREHMLKSMKNMSRGLFPQLVEDTINVPLRCEICNDVNHYEIEDIIIGSDTARTPFFIKDEFPCASCGDWPEFEHTSQTSMVVMAATVMMSLSDAEKSARMGVFSSPGVLYRGDERKLPDVIEELEEALEENPDSMEDNLRMARVQYTFGRPHVASKYYGLAMDLEPKSIEAVTGLAKVMTDTGNPKQAFDLLCSMRSSKDQWRYFREDEVTHKMIADEFLDLYRSLRKQLGRNDQPVLLPSFFKPNKRKVGRNDRCPCGSGKKYKKCCLN